MTAHSGFKKVVRARMAETGESYTTAKVAVEAECEAAQKFYDKTVRSFFRQGRLQSIPVKRKARVIVILELLRLFEADRAYPEKEVNQILGQVHEDFAFLRRELIDYGYMSRADGIYRVAEAYPEPGHTFASEILPDAAHRFEAAKRA